MRPGAVHVSPTVFQFGGELVVGAAQDAEVLRLGTTTSGSRLAVVELQPGARGAAGAVSVDPGAGEAIALEDGSAFWLGDGDGSSRG